MRIVSTLNKARSIKKTAREIKASFNLVSLAKYFDPFTDWLFGIALILAIFKDLLDMVSLGMFGLFTTFFISFVIWMIMFITGSGMKKRLVKAILKRYGTLAIGSLFEIIFGLNVFPITTFMVIVIFYLTLRERKMDDMEEKIAENEKGYPAGAAPARA